MGIAAQGSRRLAGPLNAATHLDRMAAWPESSVLRARFAEAARGLPFRVEAFEPFFAAVEKARTGALMTEQDYAGTALALRLGTLVRHDGARWDVVVPLTG